MICIRKGFYSRRTVYIGWQTIISFRQEERNRHIKPLTGLKTEFRCVSLIN